MQKYTVFLCVRRFSCIPLQTNNMHLHRAASIFHATHANSNINSNCNINSNRNRNSNINRNLNCNINRNYNHNHNIAA